jgi:hypothetical protein
VNSILLFNTTFTHTISSGTMPLNTNIYYKVASENGVGVGTLSPALEVKTPAKPSFMNTPTAPASVINPTSIVISWTPLDNATQWELQGRDVITYYTLECDPDTGTFAALNPGPGSIVTSVT